MSVSLTPIVALSYHPSLSVFNTNLNACPGPAAGTVIVLTLPGTPGAEDDGAIVIVKVMPKIFEAIWSNTTQSPVIRT